VDINKAIYSSMDESTTGFKKTMRNIRLSSGTTYGELQMPESAPLIFPALEQKIAMEGDENVKKENALKRTGNFINDYMDRRAQAAYVRLPIAPICKLSEVRLTDSRQCKIQTAPSQLLDRNLCLATQIPTILPVAVLLSPS
jgi:hypothetical protein